MASNPKYGVTYKTTDGKTKTITGMNLGVGGYTEQEITSFIGILASATNKIVLSVNVTAANSISPPEPPAPVIPDLINSLTIIPNTVTVTAGETATADILIETSPADATYSLSVPDAPNWILIDDTTLVFAPDVTVPSEQYEITLRAATKNDSKETTVTTYVEKPKEDPDLQITQTNGESISTWQSIYYSPSTNPTSTHAYFKVHYNGQKRPLYLSGIIPKGRSGSLARTSTENVNKIQKEEYYQTDVRLYQDYSSSNPGSKNYGDAAYEWTFRLSEDETYREVIKTITITEAPNQIARTWDNIDIIK